MPSASPDVVIAGHICLDVIPAFGAGATRLEALLAPGKLVEVGPPVLATGGAVSNTGLTLHRLGFATRLMGKVGDDLFGRAVLDVLRDHGPALADGMIVAAGEPTSYTIVLNPPGLDRIFLHCPGANDTYGPGEVNLDALGGARLVHFGYPPLMRATYADGGRGLAGLFEKIRERGPLVSLDMAQPDPDSEAGRVDWAAWLATVLPHVDLFAPSFDETLFMLDRTHFDRMRASAGDASLVAQADAALLDELAGRLLGLGCGAVALKLGDQGLYLRSAAEGALPASWQERHLFAPCFQVDARGTTGAGDATIGGLLGGLLRELDADAALTAALAVGASSVEEADSVSGVPGWDAVQARVRAGWGRRPFGIPLPDWTHDAERAVWHGPDDRPS